MKIGYARVSTGDQSLDLQIDALKKAGCDEILTDIASGVKADRPGLRDAFRFLREGDTLIVWKLDRLGRSISHLIQMMQEIDKRKAIFHSLQESIDTSTSMGKLIFHFTGALAEFERSLIRERTNAGLLSARARGRMGGRRPVLTEKQIVRMKELYNEGKSTASEIAKIFGCSRTTLYTYVKPSESQKNKSV